MFNWDFPKYPFPNHFNNYMLNKNKISIIIVTYNSEDYIERCLSAIVEADCSMSIEIIIIDNASKDLTTEIIKREFPFVKLTVNDTNIGFARANNQALKVADGTFCLLLNPDTIISKSAIKEFYQFMKKKENKNIWCVGGALYDQNDNPQKSYGRFPKISDVLFEQCGFYKIFKSYYKKYLNFGSQFFCEIINVDYISGACLFIRSSVFAEIGFFDEDFFLNYEETELFYRANKKRYQSVIISKVKIKHFGRKSFTSQEQYIYNLKIGELLYFKKRGIKSFIIVKILMILGGFPRLFYPGGYWKKKLFYDTIKI